MLKLPLEKCLFAMSEIVFYRLQLGLSPLLELHFVISQNLRTRDERGRSLEPAATVSAGTARVERAGQRPHLLAAGAAQQQQPAGRKRVAAAARRPATHLRLMWGPAVRACRAGIQPYPQSHVSSHGEDLSHEHEQEAHEQAAARGREQHPGQHG